jgi:hypothetical protein
VNPASTCMGHKTGDNGTLSDTEEKEEEEEEDDHGHDDDNDDDDAGVSVSFLAWAGKHNVDGKFINPSSSAQIQTLLFGGMPTEKGKDITPVSRTFKVPMGRHTHKRYRYGHSLMATRFKVQSWRHIEIGSPYRR